LFQDKIFISRQFKTSNDLELSWTLSWTVHNIISLVDNLP
jgi:hypothetical protein